MTVIMMVDRAQPSTNSTATVMREYAQPQPRIGKNRPTVRGRAEVHGMPLARLESAPVTASNSDSHDERIKRKKKTAV